MSNQVLEQYKLKIKYLLSIIIFIIILVGTIMNKYGVIDLNKVNSLDPEYELNLTNFKITKNEICKKKYVSEQIINNYISYIWKYQISKYLNDKINYFSPLIGTLLILSIYLILKKKNENNDYDDYELKLINSSFYFCFFLILLQYISIILYIAMYVKVIKIKYFIDSNMKNRCIIMLRANYILKCLKQKNKIIIILAGYNLCCVILINYLLKMLFVQNNYFNQDNTIEIEEKESSINRIDAQQSFFK